PSLSYGDVSAYSGTNDAEGLKRRMFFAAIAGLGRMSGAEVERGAQALGLRFAQENSWTRSIAKAAREHEPGTVVLLAAIGMQTRQW
ncbi:hypothetical protein C1X77_26945, partial [Pseudomonas sp. GW531-E2]